MCIELIVFQGCSKMEGMQKNTIDEPYLKRLSAHLRTINEHRYQVMPAKKATEFTPFTISAEKLRAI